MRVGVSLDGQGAVVKPFDECGGAGGLEVSGWALGDTLGDHGFNDPGKVAGLGSANPTEDGSAADSGEAFAAMPVGPFELVGYFQIDDTVGLVSRKGEKRRPIEKGGGIFRSLLRCRHGLGLVMNRLGGANPGMAGALSGVPGVWKLLVAF